jgi:hypothetical protein
VIIIAAIYIFRRSERGKAATFRGSVEVPMDGFGGFEEEEDKKPSRPAGFFASLSNMSMLGGASSSNAGAPMNEAELEMQIAGGMGGGSTPSDWVKSGDTTDRRSTAPDLLPKATQKADSTSSSGSEWSLRRKTADLIKTGSFRNNRTESVKPPSVKERPEMDRQWSNNPMANPMFTASPPTSPSNPSSEIPRPVENITDL